MKDLSIEFSNKAENNNNLAEMVAVNVSEKLQAFFTSQKMSPRNIKSSGSGIENAKAKELDSKDQKKEQILNEASRPQASGWYFFGDKPPDLVDRGHSRGVPPSLQG